MDFSPTNKVVQLCLQGMEMETKGEAAAASRLFLQAWDTATNDFEHFLAAYYVARQQTTATERLKWLETALELVLKINNQAVNGALPALYLTISRAYAELNDPEKAEQYAERSVLSNTQISDQGPFYHGTKARLQTGDLLTAGYKSNYHPEVTLNHIYFTAVIHGAGLAAELAQGEGSGHVYIVEPTGSFENDPNVTDKKFPGNPTRSYRTSAPLKIVGEVTDWVRLSPEELRKWQERMAKGLGEIIN